MPFQGESIEELMASIVKEEPVLPESLSKESQDFIRRLLAKNPSERLAGEDVFQHQWFNDIDWTALRAQKLTAPFLPVLDSDQDTRFFDEVLMKSESISSMIRSSPLRQCEILWNDEDEPPAAGQKGRSQSYFKCLNLI